jgi:3-hydroxybutyryl-CoA dehydratase
MIGRRGTYERIVTAEAIAAYCSVTGDADPLHVDAAFAARSPYGEPIAPGGLVIGFMMAAAVAATGDLGVAVPSVGFDRLRHTAPARIGDALRVDYRVVSFDGDRGHADITVVNQRDETVAVADHVFVRMTA